MAERLRVGFLMNPVAGLGGPAGLKGSDDVAGVAAIAATTPFEESHCFQRAVEAFSFMPLAGGVVVAAPGVLGADALKVTIGRNGPIFEVKRLGLKAKPFGQTTAQDTRMFARALADSDIDLLVFAGGDGTAIDVAQAVAGRVPILGVPAGVKMLSGVFAQTPAMARELLRRLKKGFATKSVDVVDLNDPSR